MTHQSQNFPCHVLKYCMEESSHSEIKKSLKIIVILDYHHWISWREFDHWKLSLLCHCCTEHTNHSLSTFSFSFFFFFKTGCELKLFPTEGEKRMRKVIWWDPVSIPAVIRNFTFWMLKEEGGRWRRWTMTVNTYWN